MDDILQKVKGATMFTEVDLSQGYMLAEESRHTAFRTPDDEPHRFTRLIIGACPSREYFHEVINQIIRHVPNCENISDNIWLWSQDMAEHIKQLDQLLGTLQVNGITLNYPNVPLKFQKLTSLVISSLVREFNPTRKPKPLLMHPSRNVRQKNGHF